LQAVYAAARSCRVPTLSATAALSTSASARAQMNGDLKRAKEYPGTAR
jgi:hypothetical protein